MLTMLIEALDRLADQGRTVTWWWRDDDATRPGPKLDRLCRMAADRGLPVMLAVVPEQAVAELAYALPPRARIFQHGIAHQNHAPAGEKRQELGAHRPLADMLADLEAGREKLAQLFPDYFDPVLVPPWNRIAPALVDALEGYQGLSTFGTRYGDKGFVCNTHVDAITWRPRRAGRGAQDLGQDFAAQLNGKNPVGLLTHHIVHDETAWDGVERLVDVLARHGAARAIAPFQRISHQAL